MDNATYQNNGLVQNWESLGGSFTSAPAAVYRAQISAEGWIDVFARGGDYGIWQRAYRGQSGWSDWLSAGGSLTSAPAASSGGAALLDVFAGGNDNALWHRNFDENRRSWTNWEPLGGSGLTSLRPRSRGAATPGFRITVTIISTSMSSS